LKFLNDLPQGKCKPFGHMNIENIDTTVKQHNFARNVIIIVAVIFILLKLFKSKSKGNLSLLGTLFAALRGVKTSGK
jgi:hypothetical protein